ncbi:MAG: hypothetical protein D6819_06870, partial [Gammaproteobacteria bacterium]
HRLTGTADLDISLRNRLRLQAAYLKWHDPRGSDTPIGTVRRSLEAPEPDKWHSTRYDGTYSFGAPGARGRIDLHAARLFRRYDNNDQEVRDRDTTELDGTFYFRVKPKTSLLLELGKRDIDYINQPPEAVSLDSSERRYLLGATWEATAKTTGTVKFGRIKKIFDAAEREDFSGGGWDVNITWRPRSYSTVDLLTSRKTYEQTTGVDDFVLVKDIALQWSHKWTQRLDTRLKVSLGRDDYNRSDRQDDRKAAGIELDYQLRRWLDIGLGYDRTERDSNVNEEDYQSNVFRFSLKAAL